MPGNSSKTKETILSDTLNVLVKTLLLGVQIKPLPVCFCCLFVVFIFFLHPTSLSSSVLLLVSESTRCRHPRAVTRRKIKDYNVIVTSELVMILKQGKSWWSGYKMPRYVSEEEVITLRCFISFQSFQRGVFISVNYSSNPRQEVISCYQILSSPDLNMTRWGSKVKVQVKITKLL